MSSKGVGVVSHWQKRALRVLGGLGRAIHSEHNFRQMLQQCGLKREAEKGGLQKHLFSYFRTKTGTNMAPERVGWVTNNAVKKKCQDFASGHEDIMRGGATWEIDDQRWIGGDWTEWSVHLDGLGDRVASELKYQIYLSLPAGEWAGYLFFLNLYLLLHQTDVKAHTSKGRYKE